MSGDHHDPPEGNFWEGLFWAFVIMTMAMVIMLTIWQFS